MARKVFFSFHYANDSMYVSQVRNCNVVKARFAQTQFLDHARWESVRRQGDAAIKRWIDSQFVGSSVTVVLIGAQTASRRWVKYEIEQSIARGNGLLGIRLDGMRAPNGAVSQPGSNPLPAGYPVYRWVADDGRNNIGSWIERAARLTGR